MNSLNDASRRLRVPIEVLWKWIGDGSLEAHVQPGRGFGMEYLLDPDQMKQARELRDADFLANRVPAAAPNPTRFPDADNIIPFDFSEANSDARHGVQQTMQHQNTQRNSALMSMENLRDEALAAIRRQTEREATMMDMVGAVDNILTTTMKALVRAQDFNEARVSAELEVLRSRLAEHVRVLEDEELALRDELARARTDLADNLRSLNPDLDLSGLERTGGRRVIEQIDVNAAAQQSTARNT